MKKTIFRGDSPLILRKPDRCLSELSAPLHASVLGWHVAHTRSVLGARRFPPPFPSSSRHFEIHEDCGAPPVSARLVLIFRRKNSRQIRTSIACTNCVLSCPQSEICDHACRVRGGTPAVLWYQQAFSDALRIHEREFASWGPRHGLSAFTWRVDKSDGVADDRLPNTKLLIAYYESSAMLIKASLAGFLFPAAVARPASVEAALAPAAPPECRMAPLPTEDRHTPPLTEESHAPDTALR